jgi:molybdopterin synthase catalytic subunit
MSAPAFELSGAPLDTQALRAALDAPRVGGVVVFEGLVRDHQDGRAVRALAYQAYAELARREGALIVAEARERFAVEHLRCAHRTGELAIGDVAVWVGAAAAHRDAAFAACRYVIDEVKRRVPIWKKEYYADGESEWIHP